MTWVDSLAVLPPLNITNPQHIFTLTFLFTLNKLFWCLDCTFCQTSGPNNRKVGRECRVFHKERTPAYFPPNAHQMLYAWYAKILFLKNISAVTLPQSMLMIQQAVKKEREATAYCLSVVRPHKWCTGARTLHPSKERMCTRSTIIIPLHTHSC